MIGIKSDVGNVRELNEDFYGYFENEEFRIYIVADGMGGHNSGEVASETACREVLEFIKDNFYDFEDKEDLLKNAFRIANIAILTLALKNESSRGMGTTLVSALIYKENIYIANVGDSSCYLKRGSEVMKITKDHSLVQELIDSGSISKEEARNHPNKNVITRAIGTSTNVEVDIFKLDYNYNDIFMLCTDGLSNEIDVKQKMNSILDKENFQSICDNLVETSKRNGGRDNVTVMLFGGEV